jgi:hypothetical protein
MQHGLKQDDNLSPLLSNFASGYTKVHENKKGLEVNRTHQLLVYADENIMGEK